MSSKFFGRTTGTASFSSGFRVGNNKLFVDSSLDRVGIGTTDPTSTLDVQGDGNFTDRILVGKTSVDNTTAGHRFDGSGFMSHVRDGNTLAVYNRLTSDGEVLQFRKNGNTFGSIGVNSTDNLFISGNSSHSGISLGTNSLVPFANGAMSDNTEDIGHPSYRWRDGHFSGTVTATNITQTPYDAVPAYSNTDYGTISWDTTEHALKLQSETDTSIGVAFPAFRVDTASEFKLSVHYKGSAASSDGFYARIYEYDSELPVGKTHISHNSSTSASVVQEDTSGQTNWQNNTSVPTDWTTSTFTYTPTSGAKWASIVVLNWTAHGTKALYLKEPLIQASASSGGDYREGEVIEEFHSAANGGTLGGNSATVQNVTARQSFGTSYTDINGSVVSNYVVPTGTKTVVYDFSWFISYADYRSIGHFRLYYRVGSGSWTEVTNARTHWRMDRYGSWMQSYSWPFTVGEATADTSNGVLTEATPTLSFKWMGREYSSSYEFVAHQTYVWDGGGTDQMVIPRVSVKSIAGS